MIYQAGEPDMMHRDQLCGASLAQRSRFVDNCDPPGARPPGTESLSIGATPRSILRGVVCFGLLLLTVKGVLHALMELVSQLNCPH